MADLLIRNIGKLYTPTRAPFTNKDKETTRIISNAFVAVKNGLIEALGEGDGAFWLEQNTKIFDAKGMIMTPGFIDSHTHLVHAGSRENEYAMKLSGMTYLEILQKGGGILSTVKATRNATFDELYDKAKKSLDIMLSYGVTSIEAKSGYGLDIDTELKQLEVAKILNENHPVEITSTFLGAHAYPAEYKGKEKEYLEIVKKTMDYVKEKDMAEYIDVFIEKGVFGIEASEDVIKHAKALGLKVRLHADEMNSFGAVPLGIKYDAASLDHLMMISDKDIDLLASSDTVATLLPMTSFYLNEGYAPARKLLDKGAIVAVAGDYNPGSSPSENYLLALQLAAGKLKMTPEEILASATVNPAYSLNKGNLVGRIEKGMQADLVLLDAPNFSYVLYHFGINHVKHVFKKGKLVYND
ncbi:MAG TPA: imidazolonepropionase [Bacillota bacterium]|nr:imidazolonepropionase [Bacillota bacterium]